MQTKEAQGSSSQRGAAPPSRGQVGTYTTCQPPARWTEAPTPFPRTPCIPDKGGSAGLSAPSLSVRRQRARRAECAM